MRTAYIGFEPSAFCVDYLRELIATFFAIVASCQRRCANAGIVTLNTNNAADTSASMIDSVRGGQGRTLRRRSRCYPLMRSIAQSMSKQSLSTSMHKVPSSKS